jgi:hypothetical protein
MGKQFANAGWVNLKTAPNQVRGSNRFPFSRRKRHGVTRFRKSCRWRLRKTYLNALPLYLNELLIQPNHVSCVPFLLNKCLWPDEVIIVIFDFLRLPVELSRIPIPITLNKFIPAGLGTLSFPRECIFVNRCILQGPRKIHEEICFDLWWCFAVMEETLLSEVGALHCWLMHSWRVVQTGRHTRTLGSDIPLWLQRSCNRQPSRLQQPAQRIKLLQLLY